MAGAVAVAITTTLTVAWLLAAPPGGTVIPGQPTYDMGETIIKGPLFYEPVYNPCTQDYRPDYGLPCERQRDIFGQLPGVPADMVEISKGIMERRFVTLDVLGDRYWRNPELYPGWSKVHLDSIYRDPDPDRNTPIGFGAYPWAQQFVVRQGTAGLTFVTFLHAGWGITHWQGMALRISLPEVALNAQGEPLKDDAGEVVTQDPSLAALMRPRLDVANDPIYEQYKDTLINPLPPERRLVVLDPNYPSFQPGWVVRIAVRVDLSSLPPGTYFFTIIADTPGDEVERLYFTEYGYRFIQSGFGAVIYEGLVVVV